MPDHRTLVHLRKRLSVWLSRPFSHKVSSVSGRIRSALKRLLSPLMIPLYRGAADTTFVREIAFDAKNPADLLISNCGSEIFVVAAADKEIGKSVYVKREAYDFKKLKSVISILGYENRARLLVDVGANIGTVCIPAVKKGCFEKAIAIEPEPRNYSILLANIALNQLTDRITVHNIALGASNNHKLMLELCQNNLGNHRIRTEENGSRLFKNSIAVKSETLDSVVGELDDLSRILIWIDTQGYEGYILSGASIALKHNIPICLEFWPHGMAESGCYPILKQEILRHKYRYYYNLDDIDATPVVLSDNSLDALYERLGDEGSFTDLLIT